LLVRAGGGVALATDVYRPSTDQPGPVVLMRVYTGKASYVADALSWVGRGFACVVQDVRGRFDSDGAWRPYRFERDDAKAVTAWLTDQRWCDGRVVVCGASYAAFTAWSAATASPEVVRAVISMVPAMGLQRVKFDRSGTLLLAEHAAWWMTYGETRTSRRSWRRRCSTPSRACSSISP
jgi:putative CocE/NonD family hydrolase